MKNSRFVALVSVTAMTASMLPFSLLAAAPALVTIEERFSVDGTTFLTDLVGVNAVQPGQIITERILYDNYGDVAGLTASIAARLPYGFTRVSGTTRNCITPSAGEKVCNTDANQAGPIVESAVWSNRDFTISPTAGLYDIPGSQTVGVLEMGKKRYMNYLNCDYINNSDHNTDDYYQFDAANTPNLALRCNTAVSGTTFRPQNSIVQSVDMMAIRYANMQDCDYINNSSGNTDDTNYFNQSNAPVSNQACAPAIAGTTYRPQNGNAFSSSMLGYRYLNFQDCDYRLTNNHNSDEVTSVAPSNDPKTAHNCPMPPPANVYLDVSHTYNHPVDMLDQTRGKGYIEFKIRASQVPGLYEEQVSLYGANFDMATDSGQIEVRGSQAPQCSDGIDNDGDGLVDFPTDPGCTSLQDPTEENEFECSGVQKYRYIMTVYSSGTWAPTGHSIIGGPVSCAMYPRPADEGSTFLDERCLIYNGSTCQAVACLYRKPSTQTYTYAITGRGSSTQAVTCTDLSPGPGYNLVMANCTSGTSSGGCAQQTCFWEKPTTGVGPEELLLGNAGTGQGEHIVECSQNPPAGYSLKGHVYIVGEVAGYHSSDLCLYGKTVSCEARSQCGDGVDNADPEDTLADYNDPGCYTNGTYNPNDNDETNVQTTPQCRDGIDNDNDGAVDYPADFSCGSPDDNDETFPNSQCQDGIDNDNDGFVDYPQDPGCNSYQDNSEVNTSQCSDGIDNDNDGATDYPADFSCSGPNDNDETNPKSQCQDGIDNDNDGLVDYPQDPGCSSKQDNDETNSAQVGCIDIVKETFDPWGNPLPITAQFTFTLDGVRTTVNASNGRARFSNVSAGLHTVTETIPSGWRQILVTPVNGNLNVPAGNGCAGIVFKNQQYFGNAGGSSSSRSSSAASTCNSWWGCGGGGWGAANNQNVQASSSSSSSQMSTGGTWNSNVTSSVSSNTGGWW